MTRPDGEATEQDIVATLSLDSVFSLLTDRTRRLALYHLHDQPNGVATMPELAAAVASYRNRLEDQPADEEAIAVALAHVHLPRLEACGVLEMDERTETVRYWRHPSLDEWLEHAFHTELAE